MHSGKAFPRAVLALGEELTPLVASGAVCLFKKKSFLSATLGKDTIFPEPKPWHSGKTPSSPSDAAKALGEDVLFPESRCLNTRGRHPLPREPKTVHSGKPFRKFFYFFAFPFNQQSIYIYIYHNPKINNNISQTTFIYITNDQIYTKFKIYYKPHVQEYILFQVHKFNT